MSQPDLILLHPPSVYDFRQKAIFYGPISDLIPSTPVFEMYPLGFLTMASYLEARGISVRIVNLALKMINSRSFDVPSFLAKLRPRAFGIDLHWLPHAHGAIEIARLLKSCHPTIPVIFGGYSASYFHEELIDYPEVDFVLRGDSVEPLLYELLGSLQSERNLAGISNLTWKSGGRIRINPPAFVPTDIDYVDIAPQQVVKMVFRYRDLEGVLPFSGWWQNPITAVFNVRGCSHSCVTCGGSQPANARLNARHAPAFRSPQKLVRNIHDISRILRGPIFLVGDLCQAGASYARETLTLLNRQRIDNEIVFEVFGMPSAEYLREIDASVNNWSLELSPESHDEEIRRRQDRNVFYRNAEMEDVIRTALSLRCHRVDVFFMIGLPGQSRGSVMETIRYCRHLFETFDQRMSCFISPLGPFLDPGSSGFESPEVHGYRLFARTLEEHRQLLVKPSWKQIFNYETTAMNRDELVAATYDAATELNDLKMRFGRIDRQRGRAVADRIAQARALEALLSSAGPDQPPEQLLAALRGDILAFSVSTVCDKRELFWRRHVMNVRWREVLRIGMGCLRDRFGLPRRQPKPFGATSRAP